MGLNTNLWGRAAIYGAELVLSIDLWGRAPIYGAELVLTIDLWGRAPIYGAEHQSGGQSPPPMRLN